MRVLSMFDGISCGRVALDRIGITPEVYYASEIDKYAERVSADNWPDTVRLGDAYGVDGWSLGPIDLLLGGSPCTHWSIAQKNNRETESSGVGWELFSLYVKALERYKPRYFLYENVKSMSPAIREEITRALGVEPIAINSALVSAQNRQRLYWTNIPGVEQPADRGIYLPDVLESGITDREKAYCLLSTYWKENTRDYIKKAHGQMAFEPIYPHGCISEPVIFQNPHGKNMGGIKYGKAPTVTGPGKYASNNFVVEPAAIASGAAWRGRSPASRYEVRVDGKSNAVTAEGHQSRLVAIRADGKELPVYTAEDGFIEIREKKYKINLPNGHYVLRKLTATECCRLQTLPDDYCKAVSESQAYRTIGNGWTVDVIAHILGYMRKEIAIP